MRIDLNADVGEFPGAPMAQDEALIPLVTSVNIACGFHAGDPHTMRATVQLALKHGVAVGAHPGFPDRDGFGRRPMTLTVTEIEELVAYQVGALAAVARTVGGRVAHVKPHGALYNMAARDAVLAGAVARAIAAVDRRLVLVGPAGSGLIDAGRAAGLQTASEGFVDRGYGADGRLLPRGTPGALIQRLDTVAERAVRMVRDEEVLTVEGRPIRMAVDTLCIHGDTPGAPALATGVREALTAAGVTIAPFGLAGGAVS